jgi:hypothetical protein
MIRIPSRTVYGVNLSNWPGTLQCELNKAEFDPPIRMVLKMPFPKPCWRIGTLKDWYCYALPSLELGRFKGMVDYSFVGFSEGDRGELVSFWLIESRVWLKFWIEDAIDIATRKFKRAGDVKRGDAR